MATYRELIYMVLDELKVHSDDSTFEEEHIKFLLNKYRAMLIKQRYSDSRRTISLSNYQLICLDVGVYTGNITYACQDQMMLISSSPIPNNIDLVGSSTIKVTGDDVFDYGITNVPYERFKHVGYSRFLTNIIYSTLAPDNYIYLKSQNPQFGLLESIKIFGIFENPEEAFNLRCTKDTDGICDILDYSFPIEEQLQPQLIQLVLKELLGVLYRPEDKENDANDNLSEIRTK